MSQSEEHAGKLVAYGYTTHQRSVRDDLTAISLEPLSSK